jgi:putative hydrolase of the HAD superfamily
VGRAALAAWDIADFASLAWQAFLDGERDNIFDRTLTDLGVWHTADDIARLVRVYRTHLPQISLLPDARNALDELQRLGVGLAVLTDGPVESQTAKVQALGLRTYTDAIVLTDAFGPEYRKPSRRGFQHIASVTGAQTFAYVADNPTKDFAAPKQLDWATIRVRRRDGLHASCLNGSDIDESLDDLVHIVKVLAECWRRQKTARSARKITCESS